MAKFFTVAALLATALCFSSLLGYAHATDYLDVEGKIYCDPCRVEFETRISEPLSGAKVELVCHSRENGTVTYTKKTETDATGTYHVPVDGDHEEDICEIKLISSPRDDCSEQFKTQDSARILLTKNVGVVEATRYANALGFMKKSTIPECALVLREMGFLPLEQQQ